MRAARVQKWVAPVHEFAHGSSRVHVVRCRPNTDYFTALVHKRNRIGGTVKNEVRQVSVGVGGGHRVVQHVAVEVEGLGVLEVRVGNRVWGRGPIGGEEAAEAGGIVAGAEVAEVGFRVEELA